MSMEPDEGYELIGVQNDGEPAAVVENPVDPTPEQEEPVEKPEGETTEPEEDDPEGDEDKPKGKGKPTGSQRARERARRLEIENEILRQRLNEAKPSEPAKPVNDGRPKPDAFESHEDYIEALVEYRLQDERRKAEFLQQKTAWEQKVEAGREKYDDFDDVIESAPPPSEPVAALLLSKKVNEDVMYYLATHPKEYRSINQMSATDAAFEIAEIKAKISKPSEKPKPTTKAPPPPAPVRGSAASLRDDDGYVVY